MEAIRSRLRPWLWVVVAAILMLAGGYLSVHEMLQVGGPYYRQPSFDLTPQRIAGAMLLAIGSLLLLIRGIGTNRQAVSLPAAALSLVLYEVIGLTFWDFGNEKLSAELSAVQRVEGALMVFLFCNPFPLVILLGALQLSVFIFALTTPARPPMTWPQRILATAAMLLCVVGTAEVCRLIFFIVRSVGPVR